MQCYHLMVVVNKMWSKSSGTASLEIGTASLEMWCSLRKRSPWSPKNENLVPKKKVFPQIHLNMDFLQKTASKLVKFGLCSSISDLQTPIWGHHPMLYFPSQIQRNIVLCYAKQTHAAQTSNRQLLQSDMFSRTGSDCAWWWWGTGRLASLRFSRGSSSTHFRLAAYQVMSKGRQVHGPHIDTTKGSEITFRSASICKKFNGFKSGIGW